MPAGGAARDEQVRHVDARDQQQETDRTEQREQREADVAHEPVREPLRADADRAVGVRIFALEPRGNRLQFAVGRLDADPRLETPERGETIVVAAIRQVGAAGDRSDRDEQIVWPRKAEPGKLEGARQDADDRVRDAVERQRAPDDPAIGAHLAAPERVRENDRWGRRRPVVIVGEAAPEHRGDPEHQEQVSRDPACPQTLRAVGAGQRHRFIAREREGVERPRPRPPVEVVRPRHRDAVPLRVDLVRVDETIGVGQRQRLQENPVHQREDRRRRADAERERREDHEREGWRLRVRPERVPDVVQEIVEKHVCAPITGLGLPGRALAAPAVTCRERQCVSPIPDRRRARPAAFAPLLDQIAEDRFAAHSVRQRPAQQPFGKARGRRSLGGVGRGRLQPDRNTHDVGSFSRSSSPRHMRRSVPRHARSAVSPAGVTA